VTMLDRANVRAVVREELDDRARRIRALAGVTMASEHWGQLGDAALVRVSENALEECARIIDALDALPVPERGK
jgi:hypothetical protein